MAFEDSVQPGVVQSGLFRRVPEGRHRWSGVEGIEGVEDQLVDPVA
jgi:hypothetical protein